MSTVKKETLYLVIPCYNEEEILQGTAMVLKDTLNKLIAKEKISPDSRILFVDDGSKDKTWSIISELSKEPCFCGIRFYQNYGHQCAVHAGLDEAAKLADITISMDADLQDDVDVIEKMVDKYYEGIDIVCGVRSSRETDTFFKRVTAEQYYKLLHKLDVDIIYNHADFRLMSRRAVNQLMSFSEHTLFLRGMIMKLGLPWDIVEYSRKERSGGTEKYTLIKMLRLAANGIIAFSKKPLKVPYLLAILGGAAGVVTFILSFILKFSGLYAFGLFLFALLTLCQGILCTYIEELVNDTKKRPRYVIYEKLLPDKE